MGDTALRVVDDETGEDRAVSSDDTALRHLIAGARAMRIDQVQRDTDGVNALVRQSEGPATSHSGWLPPVDGQPPTLGVVSLVASRSPARLGEGANRLSDDFHFCPVCLTVNKERHNDWCPDKGKPVPSRNEALKQLNRTLQLEYHEHNTVLLPQEGDETRAAPDVVPSNPNPKDDPDYAQDHAHHQRARKP